MNEKKSKVVCINGEIGRRKWKMGNVYFGGRKKNDGFKSMGDRMEVANGLIEMVKYGFGINGREQEYLN